MLLVPLGDVVLPEEGAPGLTRLGSVEAAVAALARIARYEAWRSVPREPTPPTDPDRVSAARGDAHRLLGSGGAGFLGPREITDLVGRYGLAPVGRVAEDTREAAVAAEALGAPVAVKVADPAVVHKTDRGLVRVGLATSAEVAEATREFARVLGVDSVPVLVQPVLRGVELAVGLVQDPVFGPLVMVAAGGVETDLRDDRAYLLAPVTPRDAARALRGLRIWPLLEGFRGSPAVDVEAVQSLVVTVGELALEVPEIAELDLNPVLAGPEGVALVDVKVRLAPVADTDPGTARQLRRVR